MSNVAELHLVKQRLGQLEEVVKDIDMARPRHEEKAATNSSQRLSPTWSATSKTPWLARNTWTR